MRIEITCSDRVGILQEIMAIFSDYRINVKTGEIGGDSGDKVYLSAPGLLVAQYQAIEKSLHRVAGVRKVHRIALIPSERRHFELDTLLRYISEPVLSVDREGRIVAANLAAARAFGVSHSQVPGMQLQRFLPRLQLSELLRGITVPRFGFPVTVRGREFTLDWAPIALTDDPGAVASLAGAVLTLQLRNPDGQDHQEERLEVSAAHQEPRPQILWDIDRRRDSCLRLQQLAPLSAPLLITGEPGSGKTTFVDAAYYLCPLAESGLVRRYSGPMFSEVTAAQVSALGKSGVVLIDDLDLAPAGAQRLLAEQILKGHFLSRLIVSAGSIRALEPPLHQLLETSSIHLPALRAMRPAIEDFAGSILRQGMEDTGGLDGLGGVGELDSTVEFSVPLEEGVILSLKSRDWPTNLSGLTSHLQAAFAHMRGRGGNTIRIEDLPCESTHEQLPWQNWGRGLSLPQQMDKVEKAILLEMLAQSPPGQKSTRELGRQLGISHTAVANKLKKYGLIVPEKKSP